MNHTLRRSVVGVVVGVLVIVTIQFFLPDSVTVGPVWLIPSIELLGIPIALSLLATRGAASAYFKVVVNAFLTVLVAASVMNALLLLLSLLRGAPESGQFLLLAGFAVLVANVLSFGIVYWWIDGGGPIARSAGQTTDPDFLFPQQGQSTDWQPTLLDYLFTAYTNIIAFSPTDTMPLRHRVKILFTVQSSTALLTIVVTLSRAINLIPGGPT